MFVGGAAFGERAAMICPQTGQVCLRSEIGDIDEIPEDAYDSDSWHDVPHKNELGLGRDLVFTFVSQRLPGELDRIERIFRRRGAYSSYKAFLGERGLLEEWYEYEDARLQEAILEWCRVEGIEVTG
ncbi:hypothetical protein H8E07_15935 [bacterium]|nr:hypothetical protein [bacterium]